KIRTLKHLLKEKGASVLIEVDGGITVENAPALRHCGADVLVAGNTIFKSADAQATIAALKHL
ncbi:MAG TPA: hypothetical protein VHB48_19510, partial [Chitinophagaceae bacterium]|nr:hypothetical protein [Chitinophagaceae bacterium]